MKVWMGKLIILKNNSISFSFTFERNGHRHDLDGQAVDTVAAKV
jgi:hypothetical protein